MLTPYEGGINPALLSQMEREIALLSKRPTETVNLIEQVGNRGPEKLDCTDILGHS